MKSRLVTAAVASALLATLPATRSHATWYSPNVRKGADIMMFDVRWPFWSHGTYYALWNSSTWPEGGYYYGGVAPYGKGLAGTEEEHRALKPQLVWSFWGSKHYRGDRVRPVYFSDPFYGGSMSGEGATAGVCGYYPFLRHNKWMRFVKRAWPSIDQPDTRGYVGWWVYDVELDRWYAVGVVSMPCKVRGFSGTSCFVEATGGNQDSHRVIQRRLGYDRLNGKWHKCDSISVQGRVPDNIFTIIEDGTAFHFDSIIWKDIKKSGTLKKRKLVYRVTNQPDEPTLDRPEVRGLKARRLGDHVVVEWTIPGDATPQYSYRIEVYETADASGTPLATAEKRLPYIHVVNVKAPSKARSVRLTVHDIFDQPVSQVTPVETPRPLPAVKQAGLRSGLRFSYYEAPEGVDWQTLPDMSALEAVRRGVVNGLDDTLRQGRTKLYAISYDGFIRVRKTGVYILQPLTCDGSKIYIDDKLVADNDGIHSTSLRRYSVPLEEGLHAIRIDYFKSAFAAMDGWLKFKLWLGMAGPDLEMAALGREDLMCADDAEIPQVTLGPQPAGSETGNQFTIRPDIVGKGQELSRLDFFRGVIKLGEVSAADALDEKQGWEYRTILPAGENQLRVRLWYGDGNCVDSNVIVYRAQNVIDESWKLATVSENVLPQAVNAGPDRVSMLGDGTMLLYREIEGDFVFSGRITDILHRTKENGVVARCHFGLGVSHNARNLGGAAFGFWDSAGWGLRGSADDWDLECSGMNRYFLEKDHRWVRIARRGKRWIAYSSPDGKTWKKQIDRVVLTIPPKVLVGIRFWTISEKNPTFFHGAIENLVLEQPGEIPAETRAPLAKEDLVLSRGRITGLVRSTSGTQLDALYARGIGAGLLVSRDHGETWRRMESQATLEAEAWSVRSVAAHPTDPSALLVGTGKAADGKLAGALWKTTDGGATWKVVSRDLDFDGEGASSLFGEVISFCPFKPQHVAAGGESSGLYMSQDGGDTWEYVDLKGERISFVSYNEHQTGAGNLLVGVCADSELRALGFGEPTVKTADMGRLYGFRKYARNKVVYGEMEDFGFTNLAYDNVGWAYVYFATTRSMYYSRNLQALFQRRVGLPTDTLYTAVEAFTGPDYAKRTHALAAPFSGGEDDRSQVLSTSIGYYWSPVWKRRSSESPSVNRGLSSMVSHPGEKDTFWFCNREGIYKTVDGGKAYRQVFAAEVVRGRR